MPKVVFKRKPFSKEHIKNMSLSHIGNKGYWTGKKRPNMFSLKTLKKRAENSTGSKNTQWKGGRRFEDGYIVIYKPKHPFACKNNTVKEHRFVMETYLGRLLFPCEVVHHINGIRHDNRIKNLMLFPSKGKHISHHRRKNG